MFAIPESQSSVTNEVFVDALGSLGFTVVVLFVDRWVVVLFVVLYG